MNLIRRARHVAAAIVVSALLTAPLASAADLRGGTMRVGILFDVVNFDPLQYSSVNYPLIRNLYDPLIDYTPDGKPVPALAQSWQFAPDHTSVTLTLRDDVSFTDGTPLTADAVAATLAKAADPAKGKNVYPTMSVIKNWTVGGPHAITLNFTATPPERQVIDLLQSLSPIEPSVVDTAETKVGGTGPFTLGERVLGQRIRLVANPHYWRQGEPVSRDVVFTVFSDAEAASAALQSGGIDLIYGANQRAAVHLRDDGFQLVQGPAPLVQVFRINATRGPFRNQKFRQAFNLLMDRAAILKVGYAGLGQTTALPWAPASPAADPSYDKTYAFEIDKGRALLKDSGLSPAEMTAWKITVDGGDQSAVAISQVVQNTLARAGLQVALDVKQGSELVDTMLTGKFDALFGGVGNVQKFPSRLTTNSIYRTVKNPVLGDPHPFPDYVEAIARVDHTVTPPDAVKAAYDNLNRVLVSDAFGIPTNTYNVGLIVAAKNVGGFMPDVDDIFVARGLGFTK
ncbi:MAG: ABC transporter substrate-binding protein [Acetobacteraceae bacterium]|nr:ABC transporter substrate-binding protein [Acetobacteraceae bacterium]